MAFKLRMGGTMRRQIAAAVGLGLVIVVLSASGCSLTPRQDRDWLPYLANTTEVERTDDAVTLSAVTDWRYDASGPTVRDSHAYSFDPADLRRAWFVIEPQPGSQIVAHTFILFEFEDDRLLGLTIEARREAHETYSAIRGVFNAYELSYVWGAARDLLTRRAVYLDHEVFVYPLQLDPAQRGALLARMLDRTAALAAAPRFYNTLFSNCTNELAKAVDFAWDPAFVLTGTSDEYLYRRGLIGGESFEAANARADLTDFIKAHNDFEDNADFDRAVLEELRRREETATAAAAPQVVAERQPLRRGPAHHAWTR
ncbi:MAG: DUF4105 domain-containing protein [Maricaulaceae bacterium]